MAEDLFDVTAVQCLEGHLLRLRFEDGAVRFFDMGPWLSRKPYCRLRDSALFNQARVEYGTVVWPGEIDIDPETLRNGSLSAESVPYPDIEVPPLFVAEEGAGCDNSQKSAPPPSP